MEIDTAVPVARKKFNLMDEEEDKYIDNQAAT